MYVVTVAPIGRSAFKDNLTFFSKQEFSIGSVIDVPVRGKSTAALVLGSSRAEDNKMTLRGSSYALKKINTRTSRTVVGVETMEAFKDVATYHAISVGKVMSHFVPAAILDSYDAEHPPEKDIQEQPAADMLVLQAELIERIRMYRNVARESFARGESLVIVAPTIAESEYVLQELKRGIEDQVLLITSSLTKKAARAQWKRIAESSEPLLVIGTYSALSVPFKNVHTLIVEREGARSYVGRERPHIDVRVAAEYVAKRNNARLVFADFPLRVETRARLESGDFEELSRLQVSTHIGARVHILDSRSKENENNLTAKKRKFSIFTEETAARIKEEVKKGGRVFLYASRRGLAPLTVCNDCGTPVTDPATGVPMTLQKTQEGNVFLSYRSGAVIQANISCKECSSWNLVSLGIGVERVYEEVEKLCPDQSVFLLTADSAPTHAKAKKIQKYFFDTPGCVLVGTERALPYLKEPVELSVVVSIDSLLSISAWRAHEYALSTLFFIRDHTQELCLIQTRQPDNEVIKALASGNPTEFVREELKQRKLFHYPPFATFIGLSWIGTERAVEKTTERLQEIFSEYDMVGPLPARAIQKNRYSARAVLRVEKGAWPDHNLLKLLKSLPPEIAISVDPDEIV